VLNEREQLDPTAVKVARNDATFREANEKLSQVVEELGVGADGEPMPFLCECADAQCTTIVRVGLPEYEAVRASPVRFLNAHGHHASAQGWARVVEEFDRYTVVEKIGDAAKVVAELDPRSGEEAVSKRQTRVGYNEALFRQVNEKARAVNEALASLTDVMMIACECADVSCIDQIEVDAARYAQVREDPTCFIIRPGHEAPDTESVVAREERFWIVRKDPGLAAAIASATAPRG